MHKIYFLRSNPAPPQVENHKRTITKARNDESTKRSQEKFRVFQLSCFRDKSTSGGS